MSHGYKTLTALLKLHIPLFYFYFFVIYLQEKIIHVLLFFGYMLMLTRD